MQVLAILKKDIQKNILAGKDGQLAIFSQDIKILVAARSDIPPLTKKANAGYTTISIPGSLQ
jgi:hypothetical protein